MASRLRAKGRAPLVVEANPRVGDSWRERWATLRLFTPRFVNGLPGLRFPDGCDPFPGKDEIADYQERYASEFGLRLLLGTRVTRIRPAGAGFVVTLDGGTIHARSVVIASGAQQTPRLPAFASQLDPGVPQVHSRDYGRAGTIPAGPVLVVGARNSGAEIAMELAGTHDVTLARGTPAPHAPARWRSPTWWRVAQLRSWIVRGRRLSRVLPWPIAVRSYVEVDTACAAREGRLRLAPRVVGARGRALQFADGTWVTPSTVIWATGFRSDDSWIDVPSGENGMALGPHRRGPAPGLWVVRAGLLAALHYGAIAVANDIARDRPR